MSQHVVRLDNGNDADANVRQRLLHTDDVRVVQIHAREFRDDPYQNLLAVERHVVPVVVGASVDRAPRDPIERHPTHGEAGGDWIRVVRIHVHTFDQLVGPVGTVFDDDGNLCMVEQWSTTIRGLQ